MIYLLFGLKGVALRLLRELVTIMTIIPWSRRTGQKPRILVAEDNQVTADLLRFVLERAGFSVYTAEDGLRAIAQLQQERFDLIISDYHMPHATGVDVCRYAREDAQHKDVGLFLYSATALGSNLGQMREELRITKVFANPFSPLEIVQAAKDVTRQAAVAI